MRNRQLAIAGDRKQMWVKAALNGARTKQEHPAIPVTPGELALEASAAVAAGAHALHVHPRNSSGVEDLSDRSVSEAITAIRNAVPGIPVGVTTGEWIFPDPATRLSTVSSWSVLPDFASVNFEEDGSAELTLLLSSLGVSIEAGLSSAGDTELFLSLGKDANCVRILLEPTEETVSEALVAVATVVDRLDQADCMVPRLLHGYGPTAWPLLREAVTRGYQCRIGFEDILTLPDDTVAINNAALVSAALRL